MLLHVKQMKNARIFLSVLLLLSTAAAPVSQAPRPRATPLTSPGEWFADIDYPADAVSARIEGTTVFRLEIDSAGIPQRCIIITSSGSTSLDNATCAILIARARFKPAKDVKGASLPDIYNGKISWRLPNEDAPAQLPPDPYGADQPS